MGSNKHRIHNTETDNLISNLRGEIGEIVTSWTLLGSLTVSANNLKTLDVRADLENPYIKILYTLIDKLENEIVARLSELAEQKVGRLTFHFVNEKLHICDQEITEYQRFIKRNKFHQKRNYEISHKELPEKWTEHKTIHIPYKTILRGIALSLRLMKKIDIHFLGPSAKYSWREMRNRRYKTMYPAKIGYMLLPHVALSIDDRKKIITEEMRAGNIIWETVKAKVNGEEKNVIICKKWGAILMAPGRALVLDEYPLQELLEINIAPKDELQASQELIKNSSH